MNRLALSVIVFLMIRPEIIHAGNFSKIFSGKSLRQGLLRPMGQVPARIPTRFSSNIPTVKEVRAAYKEKREALEKQRRHVLRKRILLKAEDRIKEFEANAITYPKLLEAMLLNLPSSPKGQYSEKRMAEVRALSASFSVEMLRWPYTVRGAFAEGQDLGLETIAFESAGGLLINAREKLLKNLKLLRSRIPKVYAGCYSPEYHAYIPIQVYNDLALHFVVKDFLETLARRWELAVTITAIDPLSFASQSWGVDNAIVKGSSLEVEQFLQTLKIYLERRIKELEASSFERHEILGDVKTRMLRFN